MLKLSRQQQLSRAPFNILSTPGITELNILHKPLSKKQLANLCSFPADNIIKTNWSTYFTIVNPVTKPLSITLK
jgi:hypothetical protein